MLIPGAVRLSLTIVMPVDKIPYNFTQPQRI